MHVARLVPLLLPLLAPSVSTARQEAPATTAPQTPGVSAEALAELAGDLRELVERDLVVGAELLVVQNRHVVLHEAFGSSDLEEEAAWKKGTVCNIRSMTKPLTGAAAQILIDRGKLALDEPVAKYLPGFETDASRAITLRQVLSHRAGLPLTILTKMDEFEDLVAFGNAVGARGPEYPPDSRFWYSDAGTEVVGAIVEVVSGKKLNEFVHEELLDPLGMTESFYFLDDDDPRRTRIASLHFGGVGRWKRFSDPDDGAFYPFAWGSQSLYSTPRDYAKFLALWMDGGRAGDQRILSQAAVERMLTPASEMSMLGSDARFPTAMHGLEVFYGQMAVLHVPIAAAGKGPATVIGHSGSDGTIAWAWPERDLMILCFTQSRGGGAVLRLEESIDRLLISPEVYAGSEAVPDELQPYLGTYVADWANHMKEEFVVKHTNGKFSLDVPSQMVFELAAAAEPGRWNYATAPVIQVWFERDDAGEVDCLRIRQGPLTFEAPRKGTPHEQEIAQANRPDPAVVGKYLGKYHDPDEHVDVRVFIDGDYVAIDTGKNDLVLHLWKVPTADVWQVRENPMMSVTFHQKDGKIVSFRRTGPGGSELVLPRVD
ncbi:MAG: beta-lactamase family protein [bacterium]|nr:beta-lactamase family protein [bacterium]